MVVITSTPGTKKLLETAKQLAKNVNEQRFGSVLQGFHKSSLELSPSQVRINNGYNAHSLVFSYSYFYYQAMAS